MMKLNNFLKSNPTPTVLTDPFPSQQQLIDHMSNQGNSSSTKEVQMMSSETVSLTTHSKSYDKSKEKKNENPSLGKAPPIGSPASSSNGPLTIEKPNLDMILHPPKSTLRKVVFNPNALATQFSNVVEDLAQEPCVMSTLEVLQSYPMQRKNLLTALGSLDPDNTNLIHYNPKNHKSRLPHQLAF